MKQFLVLVAVLPIVLIIMVEFSLNTMINTKVDAINDIVYTFKEQAKQDGTFADVQDDIKKEISRVTGISENEIIVDGDVSGDLKYRVNQLPQDADEDWLRDKFLHYVVKVPIKEMRSIGTLLHKNSPDYYVIDSYTASEKLKSEDQ